jgi:hypothetical protein
MLEIFCPVPNKLGSIFCPVPIEAVSKPSTIDIFDATMTHNAANKPKVTLCIAKNIIKAINPTLPKILLYMLLIVLGLTIKTTTNIVNISPRPCILLSVILYKILNILYFL